MAKAHTFVVNSASLTGENAPKLRGQAKQVMTELEREQTPRLATDIDREIAERDPFKTRQDSLRVTLYYLIIFAKKGWVTKTRPVAEVVGEPDVDFEADPESEDELAEVTA